MITSRKVALSAQPMSVASSALKPQTKDLANRQIISDLTNTDSGKSSITPLDRGKVIDFKPIPKKIVITVTNTNVDGGAIDINLFNNDTFAALPAGVTVTNSVGFSGKLLDKLMANINNGDGLLTYGFNISGYDADGTKSDRVVNASELEARYYNGRGESYIPVAIEIEGAERNTQTKDGLLTIKVQMMLTFLMQLKLSLGQEESIQFVFFTQPMAD